MLSLHDWPVGLLLDHNTRLCFCHLSCLLVKRGSPDLCGPFGFNDMTGSIDSSGCICSMWRLICLAFFGAFAWGVTWETYGAQISEHTTKIMNAVKVHTLPDIRALASHLCNQTLLSVGDTGLVAKTTACSG